MNKTSRRSGGVNGRPSIPLGILLLVVAVAIVYIPATQGGFVWDDRPYLTHNTVLTQPGGLGRIWFELGATIQYYPLLFTTLLVERSLWGLEAVGYHLVNIALHALNAILLWLLLRRLSLRGAWLASLIFAVHPVHVETVAWITQLKTLLSGTLSLLSLLAFDSYCRLAAPERCARPRWGFYLLSVGLFACALLSKTAVCVLPGVLVLVFWWQRTRLSWRDLAPLLPFFVFGLAMAWTTGYVERQFVYAEVFRTGLSVIERFLVAGRALWFYAEKLVWPANLAFIYPRWTMDAQVWGQYVAPLGVALVLVVFWLARRRIGKGPLAGVLIFAAVLFPVLGFFDYFFMRFSLVADHFQYLASIALIAMFAALAAAFFARLSSGVGRSGSALRPVRFVAGALLVVILGTLTWRQAGAYRDNRTIWHDTLGKNPTCWLAHVNLGTLAWDEGDAVQAFEHYSEAVRVGPDAFDAQYHLGTLFQNMGRYEEAAPHLQEALRLRPGHAMALTNLALVEHARGNTDQAIAHLHEVLREEPAYAKALHNLGWIYQQRGEADQAIEYYMRAVQSDPDYASAHDNVAHLYMARGEVPAAVAHWREVVRLQPSSAAARFKLGNALLMLRNAEEATMHLQEAVRIDAEYTEARIALGRALFQRGDAPGAMAACRAVLEDDPENPEARTNLAVMLLATGRVQEAVAELTRVLQTHPEFAPALLNLGKVHAMQGDLERGAALWREVLRIEPDNQEARQLLDHAAGQ